MRHQKQKIPLCSLNSALSPLVSIVIVLLLTLSLSACRTAKQDAAVLAAIEEDAYSERNALSIEDDKPSAEMMDTPNSTCFSAIGYDEYQETLYVQFRDSGSIYAYDGVPQDVYDELSVSVSMGSYYNEHIKENYTSHRLS